jgi:succinate dehydrogenase / fumarate reductase membrane anchor subunit
MVSNVTSYSRNGLRDWLLQRVSAYVLGLFLLFLLGVYITQRPMTYDVWHQVFSNLAVKLFTVLALLSMAVHAWIGVWTILTDYVKCTYARLSLEAVFMLALVIYVIWGVVILWSM